MTRRHHAPEEANESWLMSYADMITLLLCFFIIFVSTSEPRQERLKAATNGLKGQFGSLSLDTPLDGVFRSLSGVVVSNNADRNIAVEKTARGVKIEMSAVRYFAPGSAEIPETELPLLEEMSKALASSGMTDVTVEVEGHTDNELPPEGSPYTDNLALGAARAAVIAALLKAGGLDKPLYRVVSLGDTQPLVPNMDANGVAIAENQARNARVVVRIEKK